MPAIDAYPLLIIIGGPTASGKTRLSIELASHFQTEIISADSRQCYRGMDIGTATPTPEELALVKHHFINSHDIGEPFNAGIFAREARCVIEQLFIKHRVVIAAGGTGLYLKALTEGMDELPPIDPVIRRQSEQLFQEKGLEGLRQYVQTNDPAYYANADKDNPARLKRAAEVMMAGGKPYSSFLGRKHHKLPWNNVCYCLSVDRDLLYNRIDTRVDKMISEGLEGEARALEPFRSHQALQTVGYREFYDYFDGKSGLPETITLIKQHTRNFAKRQLTVLPR